MRRDWALGSRWPATCHRAAMTDELTIRRGGTAVFEQSTDAARGASS
ncbi:MAG: hypothetical protein R3C05_00890 [Pirellulaceae bacterium]